MTTFVPSGTTWVGSGEAVMVPEPAQHYIDNEDTGVRIFADLTTELLRPLDAHTPTEAPPMTPTDEFLDVAGSDDVQLKDDLLGAIRAFENDRPRSKQVHLGPSEIGEPCDRKLALKLIGAAEVNASTDKWAASIGTAVHSMLELCMRHANDKLGRVRFITEQRVVATNGQGGTGSVDCFDLDTGTVIDWKVPGPTRLAHYKKHGPSLVYQRQVQVYGEGYAQLGFDVKKVGILFLPRVGVLAGSYLWREPFDPAVAEDVFARRDGLLALVEALRLDLVLDNVQHIQPSPGPDCNFCPFYSPKPKTPVQCAGPKA